MTEREFQQWQAYAGRRMLPIRRIEIHLARIAQLIAQTMGGSKAPISEFLFDPPSDDELDEDAAHAFFDFKPLNKDNVNGVAG